MDAGRSILRHGIAGPGVARVRAVTPPPSIRRAATLGAVDYDDCFLVETGRTSSLQAEDWVRLILERIPVAGRTALHAGWTSLGLVLAPGDPGSVLGWQVRRSEPDLVLLGAESRIGMPAELMLVRRPRSLLFATLVRHETRAARLAWPAVIPLHRRIVATVLANAI